MIAVLDYGIGNLRSAEKALQHVGGDARLVADPALAADADGVVLPGVGSFGACMQALRRSGLDTVAVQAIADNKPFLGVCVGLQMLFEGSAESPGVEGLGVFEGQVTKITGDVKLPQMQWNTVKSRSACALLEDLPEVPWMYFVHTYAVPDGPHVASTCEYGQTVPAIVQRNNLWATQFHPEKSSTNGLKLLKNFVESTK